MIISWLPVVPVLLGKLISLLISVMNGIMQAANQLPFAVTRDIYATALTTFLLCFCIIFACCWFVGMSRKYFWMAASALVMYVSIHCFADIASKQQKRIIIYSIPKHTGIDIIAGEKHVFLADSLLESSLALQEQHVKSSRILFQALVGADSLLDLIRSPRGFVFAGRRIVQIDSSCHFEPLDTPVDADVLLLSGNPKVTISKLLLSIKPKIIVFDGNNSLWKIAEWKRETLPVDLPRFSIPEQGAFTLEIN